MKLKALAVDLDGTLADTAHLHYLAYGEHANYDAFHSFAEKAERIEWVWREVYAYLPDTPVIIVTARQEKYRLQTQRWLVHHQCWYDQLVMRADGDTRSDYLVKQEALRVLEKDWEIVRAYDDNPSTVALWVENRIPTVVVPGWGGG